MILPLAVLTTGIPLFGQQLPDGVDLLFGLGSYARPTATDYTINNNFIQAKNLGTFAPEGLVGLGFEFCPNPDSATAPKRCRWAKYISPFASAQFGSDTTSTVTGYTIGLSFRISRYFSLLTGYSLIPIGQPAPGFQRAAAKWVHDHPADYPTFDASNLSTNSFNAFDGFPVPQAPGAPGASGGFTYGGSILETRYQSGMFFGVAFPLTLSLALHHASMPLTLTVTPATITLHPNQTQQFVGTSSDGSAVTWSITPVVGSINPTSGVYTAPSPIPAGVQTVKVVALSGTAGPAFATITLQQP